MNSDILKDLKQLDERLERAKGFLRSSARLFDRYYTEHWDKYKGNFCWAYTIWRERDPDWPGDYPRPMPHLSVITSAMCGWAVANYILQTGDAPERLRDVPQKVAQVLAGLRFRRLKSSTFPDEAHIFVQAEVLRFLASQGQWESPLLQDLLRHVRRTADYPEYPLIAAKQGWKISDKKLQEKKKEEKKKEKKRRYGGKKLHPFFLHYCILALEQVRAPARNLADAANRLHGLREKLADRRHLTRWPGTVSLLELTDNLREALDSLVVVLKRDLLQAESAERIQSEIRSLESLFRGMSSAIRDNNKKRAVKSLSQVRKVLDNCAQNLVEVLKRLPPEIRGSYKGDTPWAGLRKIADKTKPDAWYGDDLRDRLVSEIASQISHAACNDLSRLDIGALAYSLAAATRCEFVSPLAPEVGRGLGVIFEHQRSGRWTEVSPIGATAQGTVHPPLNTEIANALLVIIKGRIDAGGSFSCADIDQTMDWLQLTFNKVGDDGGWCTEFDYSPDRIDTYVTAQVVQYLHEYVRLRRWLVIESALERAGLARVKPNVTWGRLVPSDLGPYSRQTDYAEQLKSKIRQRFLEPRRCGQKHTLCSLLLYGPPGTSKTSIMDALADKLGWPLLAISPADFLAGGGEQIEARSSLIFAILSRAKNFVVLFDEVDELLLDRDSPERLAGIFRFTTTSILPKLQFLRTKGDVIFGLATNYKERLDKAITRQGRVDDDSVVLPPDFTSRLVLASQFARRNNKRLDHRRASKLAADACFFSYKELERVIIESPGFPCDPRKIVKHPTSEPLAYISRRGSGEELRKLLDAQIADGDIKLATLETVREVDEQLRQLLEKTEKEERYFDKEETVAKIKEKKAMLQARIAKGR